MLLFYSNQCSHCTMLIETLKTLDKQKHVKLISVDYLKSNAVDAIMALDTDASLAALKAVKSSGKQIPKDIAVIGYVSERMAHNLTPELTTINQHSYTIGNSAATMMVEALRTKSKEIKQVVVSSTLTVRDST